MTTTDGDAKVHLVTARLARPADRVEGYRVTLRPGQVASPHAHDAGVFGYVLEGEITAQLAGGAPRRLRAGDAFVEPAGAAVEKFDNAGDGPATFLVFFPLAGDDAPATPA